MERVSVIIPTYNRFKYLMNTIASVRAQTHTNLEIIVVNDCSTQKEYYDYDWSGVKIVHLDKNSRVVLGFSSSGYVRNRGIEVATGDYFAYCDDDDIWFPKKLELQLKAMKAKGCRMSSTDGIIGKGPYNPTRNYKKYNAEHYYGTLQDIFKRKGSALNGFPDTFDLKFLKIHNCIIGSSLMIERGLSEQINHFRDLKQGEEDYDCWLRALEHTESAYVKDVCFYYDSGHGDGREY
jgi:glycosyltransferase involved in cell wall biosynthesis